jgi:hypothetical protein
MPRWEPEAPNGRKVQTIETLGRGRAEGAKVLMERMGSGDALNWKRVQLTLL